MYLCLCPCLCLLTTQTRRKHQSPWNWISRGVVDCCLGARNPAQVLWSAPKSRTISLASGSDFDEVKEPASQRGQVTCPRSLRKEKGAVLASWSLFVGLSAWTTHTPRCLSISELTLCIMSHLYGSELISHLPLIFLLTIFRVKREQVKRMEEWTVWEEPLCSFALASFRLSI